MIYSTSLYFLLLFSLFQHLLANVCQQFHQKFRFPCKCVEIELENTSFSQLAINCDTIAFPNDLPTLPNITPYHSYSQKNVGHQTIPSHLFTSTGLSLHRLDLSDNLLRRLNEKIFSGLQNSLEELSLKNNLLGDTLNPIFSTSEIRGLSELRTLDLSGNYIRAIEEGVFEGCRNLQEIKLDENRLNSVPSSSLNGPDGLSSISLAFNRIKIVQEEAFTSQPNLKRIDLMGNSISNIISGAFNQLNQLEYLNLAFNKLSHLNSDTFQGAEKINELDLSRNWLIEFPSPALKQFKELKVLNMSGNMIQSIEPSDFSSTPFLEVLDLSRNNIGAIPPNCFANAQYLKHINLAVNMLRAVEEDAFTGLNDLEWLSLEDNNILLIPVSSLAQLPSLKTLKLDFNRITVISTDIFKSLANGMVDIGLSYNVIREIPQNTFQNFKRLKSLDLSGNLLVNIEPYTFVGIDKSLTRLNLHGNKIASFSLEEPSALQSLLHLDISSCQMREISTFSMSILPSLTYLNISNNQFSSMTSSIFYELHQLKTLDLSNNFIKALNPTLFSKLKFLKWLSISNNAINELNENIFQNNTNLRYLDISRNNLNTIKSSTFASLNELLVLNLQFNKFSSFKGEYFVTWKSNGTLLEELILSDNDINYLSPTSFRVHPKIRKILIARNKLSYFPSTLLLGLDNMEEIDLSGNFLKIIDEFDFGKLPSLRIINLNKNQIELISESAFHNSTQLQWIDLGFNLIEKISERTFQGLNRIEYLNLKNNLISELSESIFDRSRVKLLERINLSNNKFQIAPLKCLQKQYFFLINVDLSFNQIRDIPGDDVIMVNIKQLDISFNPLSMESIKNILSEPKTIRRLNLSGVNMTQFSRLEAPFLQFLNLSHNQLMTSELNEKLFERTTLLEEIDLSYNSIENITGPLQQIWHKLPTLKIVNLSHNPIKNIILKDFEGLDNLNVLKISNLNSCIKIEKMAFKNLGNLVELDMFNYPKVGYLDVVGLLHYLPSIEKINIEIKDTFVGSEQFSTSLNPRLHHLGIRGQRITTISPGALAGVKTQEITIEIVDTSLASLPPGLLLPLPRSSKVTLDIRDNQLTTLAPQFLSSLGDRRNRLVIKGLDKNPIRCDCNARALRRSGLGIGITCSAPGYVTGKLLTEIADEDLTCDISKQTTTTAASTSNSPVTIIKMSRQTQRLTTEPDIIWSLPPVSATNNIKPSATIKSPPIGMASVVGNDDTLIMGIVGGVVAFIALLIIIICVIRLRMSNQSPPNGLAAVATVFHCNNPLCPCPKISTSIYGYGSNYSGTLPSKMVSPSSLSPSAMAAYATLNRPYSQSPYYCSPYVSDEKEYSIR